ncbi:MAG: LysE family transporter [Bdellovibrio sp.]|nr:LysE family transporter [Bdellovibrio sp.]
MFSQSSLVALALMQFVAVISPGPDFAVVVRNSLLYSRRAGIFTAIGVGSAVWIHVLYCAFGLGFLIEKMPFVLTGIKILGCSYLIYIGYRGLRALPAARTEKLDATLLKECSPALAFRQGFLTNALNPKAILYFVSVFTVFLDKETSLGTLGIYGGLIVSITLSWFLLVAFCLSTPSIREKFQKGAHWVDRVTGGVLVCLGLKLALSSLG